ncbi:MAG: Ppx/GppA phosphatase family protein [Chloracidobacterium sp.]|uniref:Ppx/GppA family phosphatase n=1 Tax=Chloracidobacterium validum TaxID=2821543 RepID=A0ABX8BAV9_9BACT|nr:Ppx/GppA phosphatase family protein [Chloracidobacterium validum]QUW02875.1 Ppx/GppA family phosphatase [Chloracidobacterium validum]
MSAAARQSHSPRPGPAIHRVAAIDIGSNSIHLIVAEARTGERLRVIEREKDTVRLAAGLTETHHLTDEKIKAAVATLRRFTDLAQAHGVTAILTVATSAIREAWNREVFLQRVEQDVGLRVEILSGIEEARLIALAVAEVTDFQGERALIVDIGGGSTEFILTTGQAPHYLASVKLGAVRLHEQFLSRQDPPTRADVTALTTHIRSGLTRTVREIQEAGGFQRVVGTSGTILALAAAKFDASYPIAKKVTTARRFYPPFDAFTSELTYAALQTLNRRLQRLSHKERRKLPGIDSRRADIIIAGGILLETIFQELNFTQLTTCEWSLREGVVINYLREQGWDLGDAPVSAKDIRQRSVLAVAHRYAYEPAHAHHTARLAERIFDQTTALHGLGELEREWLGYAALLHDIGYHIAHTSHHKHAMYLIRHAEMPGFHGHEIAILANLARYHRGSLPKRKHDDFMRLAPTHQETITKLIPILRLADALDRRHAGKVQDIKIELQGTDLRMIPVPAAQADIDLELWCAQQVLPIWTSAFPGILPRVEVEPASRAAQHA